MSTWMPYAVGLVIGFVSMHIQNLPVRSRRR